MIATPRTYRTQSGDYWDQIAMRVYGKRRGNEYLLHHLIQANYPYRNIWRFQAGVILDIPEQAAREQTPIVPWTTVRNI